MRVAVIGAGATGLSSARFLAEAGHKVVVFEQFQPGHDRGSSHGTSRITRKTYTDPYYTALMEEVFPLWEELESRGERFYHETGILYFGLATEPQMRDARASLTQNRVPFDVFGPVEVARRFSGFHLDPDEEAIFQPQAGYFEVEKVTRLLRNLICSNDGEIRYGTRANVVPSGEVNSEQFDAVILCAGAWIQQFIDLPVTVRMQHFAYYDAPQMPNLPVWVEANPAYTYGFPDYGRGLKIGRHEYGPIVDPYEDDRAPIPAVLEAIDGVARSRIFHSAERRDAYTCLYTLEEHEDFLIGTLDWDVPAFYVSGCSGHGFKFTVWFGWLIRELIEGRKSIADYPRFQPKVKP